MFPDRVEDDNKVAWATSLWKWRITFSSEVYGPYVRKYMNNKVWKMRAK